MKNLPRTWSLLAGLLFPILLTSQTDMTKLQTDWEEAWNTKDYSNLVLDLKEVRDNTVGGRNKIVYYYLATSYCRINGADRNARKTYQKIMQTYLGRSDEYDSTIEEEMKKKCFSKIQPISVDAKEYLNPHNSGGTTPRRNVSAKIASTGDFDRRPVKTLRTISMEEYGARLFKLDEIAAAKAATAARVEEMLAGTNYGWQIYSRANFILVGMGAANNEANLEKAANMLEGSLAFYQDRFGMKESPYLVTIYLPTNGDQTEWIADKLHGLQIDGRVNLGYTSHEDQTIVSRTPGGTALGTLNHELFHLLSHQFFGDIPPWLDEGVAALYERSRIDANGHLKGLENWRGPVLKNHWDQRPTVEELIETNWESLMAAEMEKGKEAVIFAMARYFAFYLQEIDKLGEVYQAMQQLTPENMEEGPLEDAKKILMNILGNRSLSQIDADFINWVRPMMDRIPDMRGIEEQERQRPVLPSNRGGSRKGRGKKGL